MVFAQITSYDFQLTQPSDKNTIFKEEFLYDTVTPIFNDV